MLLAAAEKQGLTIDDSELAAAAEQSLGTSDFETIASQYQVCLLYTSIERPGKCRIVIDTCADLSPEVAATLDVDILGFPYILDGEEFTDDIWTSITPKEFYDKLRAGSKASTSAVSLGRYIEFFTQCAEEGTPTVYLCFTSALSSSYNSACRAAEQVRAEHPDFELYVVDNALPCSCGELLAMEACLLYTSRCV